MCQDPEIIIARELGSNPGHAKFEVRKPQKEVFETNITTNSGRYRQKQ